MSRSRLTAGWMVMMMMTMMATFKCESNMNTSDQLLEPPSFANQIGSHLVRSLLTQIASSVEVPPSTREGVKDLREESVGAATMC
jgi:hypothetical protein